MKKILFAFTLFPIVSWGSCQLPKDTTLKIGCTYQCGLAYKVRLKVASFITGLPIEIIDMQTDMNLLHTVDGILIPGGADIHPRFYKEGVDEIEKKIIEKNQHKFRASAEGEVRDLFEFQVLKKYTTDSHFSGVPLLGICRGMQMMGVAEGLPLHQDIEAELSIPNREYVIDEVVVPAGPTIMSAIFPEGSFYATKLHHQGIRASYYFNRAAEFSNIRLTSFSHKKKIVESLEYQNRAALGVQFHPEMSLPNNIFEWFLNKACERKKI